MHPNSLANLKPAWPKGLSGNPNGRAIVTAGASVRQWWNEMHGWSQAEIEETAKDFSAPVAKRAAAAQWLRALLDGDELDRITEQTEGKARQAVDMNVNGHMEHTHAVQSALDRLRNDPAAMEQAAALGERLLPDETGNRN
jgi:hypothetical protein